MSIPATAGAGLLALVAGAVGGAALQQAHYLQVRRRRAQDRQPMLYPGRSFHVVTFVKAGAGIDLTAALRRLKSATAPDARWIYVGKALVTAPSRQIGPEQWSAVVLAQYASLEAYRANTESYAYQQALAAFGRSYSHGMRRPAAPNLLLPQALLFRKLQRFVTGARSAFPFTPQPAELRGAQGLEFVNRIRAAGETGAKAAVVFNFTRRGTDAQRSADAQYTGAMIDLMAERGYGPLHTGAAVPLEQGHHFDHVAIVYYPGADYFADMVGSTFYQRIFPRKQLGDSQSVVTVPMTALLDP